jgi:hypothetical protein
MAFKVRDSVNYVPDMTHALEKGPNGEYPWVIGVKRVRRVNGRPAEVVEELEGKPLEDYLAALRRSPKADEERKKLVFLRPNTTWPATVVAVHDDGTVDLDIKSSVGGVTLNYTNIELDDNAEQFHSFHRTESDSEEDNESIERVPTKSREDRTETPKASREVRQDQNVYDSKAKSQGQEKKELVKTTREQPSKTER